jgi:hypothetical protein
MRSLPSRVTAYWVLTGATQVLDEAGADTGVAPDDEDGATQLEPAGAAAVTEAALAGAGAARRGALLLVLADLVEP